MDKSIHESLDSVHSTEGNKHIHEFAHNRQRDYQGHFINANSKALTPASSSIKKSIDTSLDAPLVSVTINNPFKKILYWLNDIRKKQTTEFDINAKLKIPLLAWAVVIAILFGSVNVFQYFQNAQLTAFLNKNTARSVTVIVPTPVPSPVLLSRIGIIKATYQLNGGVFAAPTPQSPASKYILVTSINDLTFLTLAPGVSIDQYLNKRVLATGQYDAGKNTLFIKRAEDIEFLP